MRLMSDRWLLLYNAFNFCLFFMDLSLGQGVLIPRVPIGRWLFFPRGHTFRRAIFRDIDCFCEGAGWLCMCTFGLVATRATLPDRCAVWWFVIFGFGRVCINSAGRHMFACVSCLHLPVGAFHARCRLASAPDLGRYDKHLSANPSCGELSQS